MTETKCNIFGQVWLLKIFFFSNVYISVNAIFECCYLFFSWEIDHPLSMCATGGMEGESSKICTGAYRVREVEKLVIRYVRTKWINKQTLWNIFCALFRPSTLEKWTRWTKNVAVFFHHNYDYFILCNN